MYKLLLLALVPCALARIEIRIKLAKTVEKATIDLVGSSVDPVSYIERASFKLSDFQVKQAVNNYHGGYVRRVYFRSSTPWGDVFARHGWSPVSRTLVPISAKVVNITSKRIVVTRRPFTNHNNYRVMSNVAIEENVEQAISNTWSKNEDLTVGQEIEYSIDVGSAEVGRTSVSYASSWGRDRSENEAVTIGTTSGIEVQLDRRQSVISELSAERGAMEVEVKYAASLDGSVFCSYSEPHKGHYFWHYDVNALLSTENAPRTIVSTEIIKVGFYSNAMIVVRDASNSDDEVVTREVPIKPATQLKSTQESRVIVPVELDPIKDLV